MPCTLGWIVLGAFVLMACIVVGAAYFEGYNDGLDDAERRKKK